MRWSWGHLALGVLLGIACGVMLALLLEAKRGALKPLGPQLHLKSKSSLYPLIPLIPLAPDVLDNPKERLSKQLLSPDMAVVKYPYSYPFLINHLDKCQGDTAPFLLMLVMTQPQDSEAREAIRTTWGDEAIVPSVTIRRLFVLGLFPSHLHRRLQYLLEEEDAENQDLLQVGFLDTYNNLTLKTLMGLEWVARHCQTAQYVLKVDGDVFLNPSFLVHRVLQPEGPPRPTFITGYIYKNRMPMRKPHYKWYMPRKVFPATIYPPYCAGAGYVMSGCLVMKILAVAQKIKAIYLEDVFVGLCLKHLRVKPTPSPLDIFQFFGREYERCDFNQLAIVHPIKPVDLLWIWMDFQKANTTCPPS
ncbi:beta-1,3-galactosyltransferase 2-like [Trichosurus vulpecula]|uniref:beta-1,3-galactosyltransferase 2-like n=1 Tax=Trichosurus vulpecula TaxID=9337 RepID=UPI00186B4467|nr:beta-1,3-galactosyltransferase 2-like [Trichosurus vulpecula]